MMNVAGYQGQSVPISFGFAWRREVRRSPDEIWLPTN